MVAEQSTNHCPSPYDTSDRLRSTILSALEIPSGITSLMRRCLSGEPDFQQAQILIDRATKNIPTISNPQVESHLSNGFESAVFSFTSSDQRWVVKIGHRHSFAAGLAAPSTERFAALQRWNREQLISAFKDNLPHLLPSPYYILSPNQVNHPSTLQITPFIEKVEPKTLTLAELQSLKQERQVFENRSRQLEKNRKIVLDLIMPSNLIVGRVDGNPHLVLLDNGVFHLSAPVPMLNLCARTALRLTQARGLYLPG